MPIIATVNVNGIRAAWRRGMPGWLESAGVDVLCLQEVRASTAVLTEHLGPQWTVVHAEADAAGRAGVAIAARGALSDVRTGLPGTESGRWIEATVGGVRVVSCYVNKGEAGTEKQQRKYEFLDAMGERMRVLPKESGPVVVTGDFNICHTERDLKNWKGNLTHSGFLPEERAFLDRVTDEQGWVDVGRGLAGDVAGPYTWWSWRGKAFDNDAGWRIDYQLATAELAERARAARVDRAPSYAQRWSDHAPVVVEYG
ncbi:MAG TPA: exodeoxyribonuclease III [Mycobacteriales bacterium]|nr:exodeoxyribonuclease III [Mycobacteriales bacterium]